MGQAVPGPQCRHFSMRELDDENDCYSSIDSTTDFVAVAWRSEAHEWQALRHKTLKAVNGRS